MLSATRTAAPDTTVRPTVARGRPRLRGRFHQGALVVSIPAGVWLVGQAPAGLARVAAFVYAASLIGLFGASSAYHRLTGTPWDRPWLRWIDHSAIFCLIAGTYTPMCLAIPRAAGVPLLVVVWLTALTGIVLKLVWRSRFRRATGALYMVMGWAAVLALPAWIDRLTPLAFALLLGGGLLYTIGAIVLFRRRPNPSPRWFGYHEVWHVLGVAAAVCHFVMVHQTLVSPSV